MKFSLARTALALAATLTLASCGGGGKATFPVHVTVSNVIYPGLVMSTNGQDVAVNPPAVAHADVSFVFPNELQYGDVYNVIPKGEVVTGTTITSYGTQPKHQTCVQNTTYPYSFPITGTAGQLATIQVNYVCAINAYALSGTVKGLTGTGLVLANGSSASTVTVAPATDTTTLLPTGADVAFTMSSVAYGTTYGVTVLTQPAGQTCNLTAGGNGSNPGAGTMDDAAEAAGGVTNLVVTCVKN